MKALSLDFDTARTATADTPPPARNARRAAATMAVELRPLAYAKIMAHTAKYPAASVDGVLLGRTTATAGTTGGRPDAEPSERQPRTRLTPYGLAPFGVCPSVSRRRRRGGGRHPAPPQQEYDDVGPGRRAAAGTTSWRGSWSSNMSR